MTILFTDGQDGTIQETVGDLSAWTAVTLNNGTVVVDATSPHHGSNNFTFSVNSLANNYAIISKTFVATYKTLYSRVVVKFNVLPTNNNVRLFLMVMSNSVGGNISALYLLKTTAGKGKWVAQAQIGGQIDESDEMDVTTGIYYCIQLKTIVAAAGTVVVYVNGVEVANLSGFDTASRGDMDRVGIRIQHAETAGVTTVTRFDCFTCADDGPIICETSNKRPLLNVGL